jgi:iron(III) transport system permease protein
VYRTWFGLRSLPAAVQLASVLALVALALAFAERALRARVGGVGNGRRKPHRIRLSGARAWAASAAATSVLAFGFVLPALQLLRWVPDDELEHARLWAPLWSTVVLGGIGAVLVVAAGIAIAHAKQASAPAWAPRALRHLGTLGYAVPGTVLAVGVLFALVAFERMFDLRAALGFALSSSVVAVLLALVARFARVGVDAAETGYAQLRPSLGEAAATLGLGRARRWLRIDLPLLRPALLAGLMLAFVECVKELPATLMLRPFGWDTLAVKVYNATSEGLWQQAAAPALLIAVIGLVPALMLMRRLD